MGKKTETVEQKEEREQFEALMAEERATKKAKPATTTAKPATAKRRRRQAVRPNIRRPSRAQIAVIRPILDRLFMALNDLRDYVYGIR
jgi:hypothetical protein